MRQKSMPEKGPADVAGIQPQTIGMGTRHRAAAAKDRQALRGPGRRAPSSGVGTFQLERMG
jgi:hypothetical protein